MRNYLSLWAGKIVYHLAPSGTDQTTYFIEGSRGEVELDIINQHDSSYTTTFADIQPCFVSLEKWILVQLFQEIGGQGVDAKDPFSISPNKLSLLYDWPFPANPIVTKSSPRKRNDVAGWGDKV